MIFLSGCFEDGGNAVCKKNLMQICGGGCKQGCGDWFVGGDKSVRRSREALPLCGLESSHGRVDPHCCNKPQWIHTVATSTSVDPHCCKPQWIHTAVSHIGSTLRTAARFNVLKLNAVRHHFKLEHQLVIMTIFCNTALRPNHPLKICGVWPNTTDFYRTQVYLGSDLWVRLSVTEGRL